MKWQECPKCGAHLDHGEKCECEKENELPDANQENSSQRDTKSRAHSISKKKEKVKPNALRDLRIIKNLAAKEMVDTVRGLYPKYDKMLQSKCEHGDDYGIDIKAKALDALYAKYAPELLALAKHRRDGCHRLKCKVMCRLADEEYDELVMRIKEDGFDTMQSWLSFMIRQYLISKKATKNISK